VPYARRRIRAGRFPDSLCNAAAILFSEIISRLPRPPVSLLRGADELKVGAELAVKESWTALLSFLATPRIASAGDGAEIALFWLATEQMFVHPVPLPQEITVAGVWQQRRNILKPSRFLADLAGRRSISWAL